jgi:hypothetical protein
MKDWKTGSLVTLSYHLHPFFPPLHREIQFSCANFDLSFQPNQEPYLYSNFFHGPASKINASLKAIIDIIWLSFCIS